MAETLALQVRNGTVTFKYGENTTVAQQSAASAETAAAIALGAAASADWHNERGVTFLEDLRVAAGDPDAVITALTPDGAITWQDDDPTTLLIEEITTLDGNYTFTQTGTIFDGSGPTPTPPVLPKWVDGGIQFHSQTGFILATGLIPSSLDTFAINMVLTWPTVAETYADVAAMNADVAAHPVGALVYVEERIVDNGAFGIVPDDGLLGLGALQPGDLVGGYYVRGNGAWVKTFATLITVRDTAGEGGGTDYLRVDTDGLGRLVVFAYDGTIILTAQSNYVDMIGFKPGEKQSIRIGNDGRQWRLFWNGIEVAAVKSQPDFTPNKIYLNGRARDTTSPTWPVPITAGMSFTLHALTFDSGLDYTPKRLISDTVAQYTGAPKINWSPNAKLFVIVSQSEFAAPNSSTVGDAARPDPTSNWNGETDPRTINDARYYNPSQELIPGVYSFKALSASDDIGPINASINIYGSSVGGYTQSGSGLETIEWGLAKQWRLRKGGQDHLYIVGETIGGANLVQVQASSGRFLHSLKNGTISDLGAVNYRDHLLRAVIEVVDRCHSQDQQVECVLITNFQAKANATTAGTAAAHQADLRDLRDKIQTLVDGQGKPPLLLAFAPNYSTSGTGNDCNTATTNYVDDAYRVLDASKTINYPLRALTSIYAWWGRFIHPVGTRLRLVGEFIGDLAARYWLEGDYVPPLQPVSVVIGSGGDAGKLIVTYDRPCTFIAQYLPAVLGNVTQSGHLTYGYNITNTGGSAAISGDVTIRDGTGIEDNVVVIPYSGTIAAGTRLNYLDGSTLWGNLRERDERLGQYEDQDWGTIPFADADPELAFAGTNKITEWGAAFTYLLA